ncbi:MAG: hypothetical protein HC888_18060 [Candidatus Competibacteraceae bacterium]|nr:hypothetical protein [Candidatus Competibacteraceae bacterium]
MRWPELLQLSHKEQGGIQGLIDLPRSHQAFSQTIGSGISLIGATGYRQVALLQSGHDVANRFTPAKSLNHCAISSNGTTNALVPGTSDGLVVSGGALDQLDAIITMALPFDTNNSWLAVGGARGMAILGKS